MFILIYVCVINVITFLSFGYDKWLAKRNKWRVPEKKLLLLIFIGGTVGGIIGVYFFKHKSNKKTFLIPVILIVLLQLALFYLKITKMV